MLDKKKKESNVANIKKCYLELLKNGKKLLIQREVEVEKQENNFVEFNNTYYDLRDAREKRNVKVKEINSKKEKYIDKKNKKRLIISGIIAYLLPVIISSIFISSFRSSALIPFFGVCGVYFNVLFECLVFQKKYFSKYSNEFENLEDTKMSRKELEDLLLRENELVQLHAKTDEIRKECEKNINNLDKEINLIKDKINSLRISTFEDLIGVVREENEVELKLKK